MDFDYTNNYNLGKSGGSRLSIPVTGDLARDLSNHAAYDQGVASSNTNTGGGDGDSRAMVFLVEAGLIIWWVFAKFGLNIREITNDLPFANNHHIISDILIGAFIAVVYILLAVKWCEKSKWLAKAFYGVLWVVGGYWLAKLCNGNIYWQIGTPALLGLISVGSRVF